ncbi:kinase-like domain-containing protein [Syncephalis pseudoplumigaleata]|uniref:non-specific serine/threonine protein kinase n=1 Tax=Syncephalis pseudoplumigaleata TaxID=1712513 RepID=A0A4P9Z4K6_9FUNG|nr:kinase-like domain-containing protein [Syncephalis pseudoplumigaleata]|eukprot:RKP26781.1 kinase-like domain-containing protein [Syncephalis pseudoplumigaleata]
MHSHTSSPAESVSGTPWSRRSSVQSPGMGQLSRRADWTVILRNEDRGQAVMYNPLSNRVAVRRLLPNEPAVVTSVASHGYCAMCHRPFEPSSPVTNSTASVQMDRNYFRLLGKAISSTPGGNDYSQRGMPEFGSSVDQESLHERVFNQGYYERFFVEEKPLGRGLRGQVFLCQHVLDQVKLGEYAVKKVPVGDNKTWLLRMLREVHLLERLHHPNIVDYKHSWIEHYQMGSFGPMVPCLFILMECANGGNLEEYMVVDEPDLTASQRARRRRSQPYPLMETPPELRRLTLEEIEHFMLGTCEGLAHLHHHGIIHRDLKPSNLLLSYDDGAQGTDDPRRPRTSKYKGLPRVLLSDFGECEDLSQLNQHHKARLARSRSGATGTLEFMAPELIATDEQGRYLPSFSLKADMWSLGLLLYYLCYSQLPYRNMDDIDELKAEILAFDG